MCFRNVSAKKCKAYYRETEVIPFIVNNNIKFRSFKSKENIQEVGPYHGFGYYSLISDPIILAKGARGKENTVNLQILIKAVVSKTDKSKNTKMFQIC